MITKNCKAAAVFTILKNNDDLSDALMMHASRGTRSEDLVRRDVSRASWLSNVGAGTPTDPLLWCDMGPCPFVGRWKTFARSDLNLMTGFLWQNEVPAMRQNTRARIHCGFFHTTFSVVSNVDLQQHIFKLLLISLSKPRIWSQRHKAYILLRKSYILLL